MSSGTPLTKITDRLVSSVVCRLEVLEEKDDLREGQLQSLQEEVERLREEAWFRENKGKGIDQGESLFQLCRGLLNTDLEDLFAILPKTESKLSYSTPHFQLVTVPNNTEELAEPVSFQPMMGEGGPDWDEGPENEREILSGPFLVGLQ